MTTDAQTGQTEPGGEPPESSSLGDAVLINPRRVSQALSLVAIGLCFAIFWYAGRWTGIPPEMKHNGSLMQQPWGIARVIGAGFLLALCTVIANIIIGPRWYLGGLFAATAGLMAWSIRGGPMHDVLFAATSHAIFLTLLVEHLLLFLFVAALWLAFWEWYQGHRPLADPPQEEPVPGAADGPAALTIIAQILTMAVLVFILAATDNKKQSILAVGISAFAATSMANHFAPSRRAAAWLWVGPLAVGCLGYIAAFVQPDGWTLGDTNGPLAALARPLPLDYAGAGGFGALLGMWSGSDDPSVGASIIFSVLSGRVIHPHGVRNAFSPRREPIAGTSSESQEK